MKRKANSNSTIKNTSKKTSFFKDPIILKSLITKIVFNSDLEALHNIMAHNPKAINCLDDTWVLLVIAIIQKDADTVEKLMPSVDINFFNKRGHSIATFSAMTKHRKIANLVLGKAYSRNKALLNTKDDRGMTALMHATFNNNLDAIYLLLAIGVNKDAKCIHGRTALMIAAARDYEKVIIKLLDTKNIQDNSGWTALMYAAVSNKSCAAKLLLVNNACQILQNN